MATSNTSNEDDLVVRGSEKGYVHSMDYVGPYSPDVDGNIYGLVGVETGHTMVTLTMVSHHLLRIGRLRLHFKALRYIGTSLWVMRIKI